MDGKSKAKGGKNTKKIARTMNTTTSIVGRLETGGGSRKHSPTLETLRRYASAFGYELQIKLSGHTDKNNREILC